MKLVSALSVAASLALSSAALSQSSITFWPPGTQIGDRPIIIFGPLPTTHFKPHATTPSFPSVVGGYLFSTNVFSCNNTVGSATIGPFGAPTNITEITGDTVAYSPVSGSVNVTYNFVRVSDGNVMADFNSSPVFPFAGINVRIKERENWGSQGPWTIAAGDSIKGTVVCSGPSGSVAQMLGSIYHQ